MAATDAAFSATSDELMDDTSGDPAAYQWGPYALRLPEAWDWIEGHAVLGLIDRGTKNEHEDLRAFHEEPDGTLVYDGGSFREHLSEDIFFDDCNVDELDLGDGVTRTRAGHGVHVSGIIAGTTDNGIGVAGTCRSCSLQVIKALDATGGSVQGAIDKAGNALTILVDQGAQVVNMSFGIVQEACTNSPVDLSFFCQSLVDAEDRDTVVAASSGNARGPVDFPANDRRVIAVGGVAFDASTTEGYAFWDDCPSGDPAQCECPYGGAFVECGSNSGAEQDLVAPSKTVISTMYEGLDHNEDVECGDLFLLGHPGYGPCTGTSMSAPFITGLAGLARSANPLLDREEVRDVLVTTASQAAARDDQMGYGVPDAEAAVRKALGTVGGLTASNRLTPLFSLYSQTDKTHAFTTSPTMASALIFDPAGAFFEPMGPTVPKYPAFPDAACVISPCSTTPGASIYLFTTDAEPFQGAPLLVPLYRMRYDPNLPFRCDEPPPARINNRDFSYTTGEAGILHFKENLVDTNGIGYELDGIEGYLFSRCDPDCVPAGAERIFRWYHAVRDDYVIFPESELAQWQADGYLPPTGSLAEIIGYAYPNVDTDGDDLIDGFETVLGTSPTIVDSDCDMFSDGDEFLVYDSSSATPSEHGYGDPLEGPCGPPFFADGFETGDTTRWSETLP